LNNQTDSFKTDARCGYEVSLQTYLHTHSLLRGVTFEVLHFSSCALSPTMLPLLEIFFGTPVVEYISVSSLVFFGGGGILQYSEIFVTLRQILFLETNWCHSESNQ
jgi:hypothetical protein